MCPPFTIPTFLHGGEGASDRATLPRSLGKQGLPCRDGACGNSLETLLWMTEGGLASNAPDQPSHIHYLSWDTGCMSVWNLRWFQDHHHLLLPQLSSLLNPISPTSCRNSSDNLDSSQTGFSAQRVRQTLVRCPVLPLSIWMALDKLLNSLKLVSSNVKRDGLPHRVVVSS